MLVTCGCLQGPFHIVSPSFQDHCDFGCRYWVRGKLMQIVLIDGMHTWEEVKE